MAKEPAPAAKTAMDRVDPTARISWDAESKIRLSGDTGDLAVGKRIRVILEGPVSGFSMERYGNSITLTPKSIRVEPATGGGDEDGEPLTDTIGRLQGRKVGKKGGE